MLHSKPECDGRHHFPDKRSTRISGANHPSKPHMAAAVRSRAVLNHSRLSPVCTAVPNGPTQKRQAPFDTILRFKPSAGSTALSAGYHSNKRNFYAGFKKDYSRTDFNPRLFLHRVINVSLAPHNGCGHRGLATSGCLRFLAFHVTREGLLHQPPDQLQPQKAKP